MTFVSGWRLALRLAWREAVRSKARSALVLFMVTFPVVAVVAADVAQATSSVSAVEGLDRRMGSSEALVSSQPDGGRIVQAPDPGNGTSSSGHGPAPTLPDVLDALGGRRPATEFRTGGLIVRTSVGALAVHAVGVDLADPLAHGLFRLTRGRLATAPDEIDINQALASEGFAIGDTVRARGGRTLAVVGIAESTDVRTPPVVMGLPDSVTTYRPATGRTWLVGGAPVTWSQVGAVNEIGATVLSREVIEHPPATTALPPEVLRAYATDRTQVYTILALIGVMALTEVVLLAGPAFAVGARRQSRTLALIGANGGTPVQSRRMILAMAVVLGSLGAVVGSLLGIVVGRALIPLLQGQADSWFGPFQVRWPHVLGIAAFGLLSALLAALVPAWVASRQDVVAVLAGRRGDRKPSRRSPLIGLVLIGVGVLLAARGAGRGAGELLIAAGAVVSVFGMIFLVPVVVVAVARLGRRLPLPLRYAVRDAARHRTRTVPAVAAVAATVAGVVALSIGNASDQAQAKAEYVLEVPVGTGLVTDYGQRASFLPAAYDLLDAADAAPRTVEGVPPGRGGHVEVQLAGKAQRLAGGTADTFGTATIVADALPPLLPDQVGADQRAAADRVLARGGVVIFAQRRSTLDRADLVVIHRAATKERPGRTERVSLPAYVVDTGRAFSPATSVLSSAAAHRLSLHVAPTALLFDAQRLDGRALDELTQALQGLSPSSGRVYVEHGYQVPGTQQVVLWILFGMALVLMLGGTLTATFLALSDARPDLATLSAVGASPRTRRGVAAAYAVAVGLVGAVLGAAVGFIPGIAISYPLTRTYALVGPSHYLDIPWTLIAVLVVGLPLFTALVVGLLARSRLPVVARLD